MGMVKLGNSVVKFLIRKKAKKLEYGMIIFKRNKIKKNDFKKILD